MQDFLRHSVSHIFVDELSDEIIIDNEDFHHLANVLRVKVGDLISAAHEGQARPYKVVKIDNNQIDLKATSHAEIVGEKEIHLAVSLFKMDRLEWGISKAIETGARSITIGATDYSNFSIDKKKLEKVQLRLNALALSACSQSRRSHLVKINIVKSLAEHLESQTNIVVCEPGTGKDTDIKTPVTFVIGPEGGFSEQELNSFSDYPMVEISPYILRAETAMAIAPTLV